jgi:hypothetical protein
VTTPTSPKNIGQVIPGVLKQLSREHGEMDRVQRAWKRLVGPQLAAHTRPVSLRRGRLMVAVEQPGDGFELSYRRTRLVEQLKAMTDGRVTEIILRPHGVSD